jgi:hypothetical protein
MSMKVIFLKPHVDHKALDEVFISRSLGRRLCQQEIAIPSSVKDVHAGYQALMKKKRKKKKTIPKKQTKKRAVSVKSESRETTTIE